MSDTIERVVYPYNDELIVLSPTISQRNPATGITERVPVTGRNDVTVFLSTTQDMGTATPLGGLTVTLTEQGTTGTYTGTMDGQAKATALAAVADGTTLYRHIRVGTDARRVVPCVYRTVRP